MKPYPSTNISTILYNITIKTIIMNREQLEAEIKGHTYVEYRLVNIQGGFHHWQIGRTNNLVFDWDRAEYRVATGMAILNSKHEHMKSVLESSKPIYYIDKNDDGEWVKVGPDHKFDWKNNYYKIDDYEYKMDPNSIAYKLEVMTAYSKSKTIEAKSNKSEVYHIVTNPQWNWEHCYYRIKPEPKIRPFNANELIKLLNTVIVCKNNEVFSTVLSVDTVKCSVKIINSKDKIASINASSLLENFITFDNEILGVKE